MKSFVNITLFIFIIILLLYSFYMAYNNYKMINSFGNPESN
jgi:hypothetical protein